MSTLYSVQFIRSSDLNTVKAWLDDQPSSLRISVAIMQYVPSFMANIYGSRTLPVPVVLRSTGPSPTGVKLYPSRLSAKYILSSSGSLPVKYAIRYAVSESPRAGSA